MENNQQSIGERNTSKQKHEVFNNQQPGQQLPDSMRTENRNTNHPTQNEQHSESSMPQNENETLGTP